MTLIILAGVTVAIAVALFFYAVSRAMEPTEALEQRIEAWVRNHAEFDGDNDSKKKKSVSSVLSQLEWTLTRRSFAEDIATDLARADLALTVTEYLLIRVGLVLAGFALGFLFHLDPLSGLLAAVAAFFLPVAYIRSRQATRRREFNGQLPDVLDHLVGSLRAGYGPLQSLEWVGRQIPKPAGMEFDRVVREVRLGRSLGDSLDSMVRRIVSDDLALIVTAIKIHHEVGGNLADILETVSGTIRERVRLQREIAVLTAQQRYSGYILMLMPIGLAFVLFIINPEYEKQLFEPGPTLCIPIVTAIMLVAGFFVMRKIVDIEI